MSASEQPIVHRAAVENPYATEEDSQTKRTSSTPIAAILAMATSLGLLAVLLCMVVSMVGVPIYNRATKPSPSFRYGESVRVVDGFHAGRSGIVVDAHRNIDGNWRLMVNFGGDFEHVDECDLVR